MKKGLLLVAAILMLLVPLAAFSQTSPEFRSIEATSWNNAFESAASTTAWVNYSKSINLNCIIPEIRLRSDAYYTSSIEPPGTGVTISPSDYDPLADCITKAHAQNMEVHPWVVTFRVWTTTSGPGHMSPVEHIWWTHGPGRSPGADDWLMYGDTGAWDYGGIVNLDPGHPAVEDYLIGVFMDIVNRYDVDGLNLDYIRYPATNWGYNPVAVSRFNAEYGRIGSPSSSDPTWMDWRRDQISNLVKRLYLEIKAVKPHVKLSADVWNTAASGNSGYLQDWDKWMANHWIDFVHPMTYTSDNGTFDSWMTAAAGNQHGRHVYPLIDVSNSVTGNVEPQIASVRSHGFSGMGLYSYQSISNQATLKTGLLGSSYFPTFVQPVGMPWLDTPTTGYLKGFVKNASGNAIYPVTVTILSSGANTKNTGTGFYGFVDLAPGTYTVRAQAAGYDTVDSSVTVTAGHCADLNFTMNLETTPPVITNVRTANVQATNAQILWNTDEAATSQVDFGGTTSYGTTTTEDMVRVTAHTVQLVNLTPSTLYHFRVRSYDAARNVSVSTDYTLTTTASDIPLDIIVDNTDPSPYFALTLAWSTGTGDPKWGTNYFYTSPATSGKVATWKPNVISAANYNVYAYWCAGANRTTKAPYTVYWNGGSQTVLVNQQINGGSWQLLKANVPFAVGTTGRITLTNNGIETGLNVIADAIKLEYADTTAPTTPTGLSASAMSNTQVSLSWTSSTDNVGVTGYDVYRNGSRVGSSVSNSYVDSGLTANTQYSYYVKAYDKANNYSAQSNTGAVYTMSTVPGSASVTCDKPVSTWQTASTFTFTAAGGFGAGKVQYYKYAWSQSSTHSWTGFEPQWSTGTLPVQASTGGSWYLHVKGFNGDNLENGNYSYGPYKFDGSPVQVTNLNDGKYVDYTGQLHATWSGSDPETGVVEYQYAIGISKSNITGIRGWTTNGTSTSITTTGLTLVPNGTYYIGVKALNGAGVWSDPVISDGVTAARVMATITDAKTLRSDNDAVILHNKVVSANFGSFFYVCEDKGDNRVMAIRVEGTSAIEGDLTDVSGVLQTINGERVITNPDTLPASGPGVPNPIFMISKYVGGDSLNDKTLGVTNGVGTNNIGVLITIAGTVRNPTTDSFMVDDGYSLTKVSAQMLSEIPADGKFVKVTGIVSTEEDTNSVVTPLLIPRSDLDAPKPWY